MQFLQLLFRQRQLVVVVHHHVVIQDVLGDLLRFFQRVHMVSAALVFVQLRDFALVGHFQHVGHRRFPRISYALLFRHADQAHVETGTTAHRGDVDNLHALAVQVVTHKAGEQVLQRVNAALGHHFQVRAAKAQIKHRDGIAVRRLHGFRNADSRGCHTGMIDGKAIQQWHFATSS